MSVCVRRVVYSDGYEEELYVELRGGLWMLPPTIPDRFSGRWEHLFSHSVAHVSSIPHERPFRAGIASLAKGMWVVADDGEGKGGYMPCIFGQGISMHVLDALKNLRRTTAHPLRVAYHGTGGDAFLSISKTRLNPTSGQLGIGCYVGSFWKACRFAARDQNYAWRKNPIVLRVLWRCPTVTFPNSPCGCPECDKKSIEKRKVCAHGQLWSGRGAYLPPCQFEDGTWATRNEEWCIPPDAIVRLAESVDIDVASVNGPHYDPLQRSIRIL